MTDFFHIDAHTGFIISSFLNVLMASIVWALLVRLRGWHWNPWCLGGLLGGIYYVLVANPEVLPPTVAFEVSHALLWGAGVCMIEALRRDLGRRPVVWPWVLATAVGTAFYSALRVLAPTAVLPYSVWVGLIGLVTLVGMALLAWRSRGSAGYLAIAGSTAVLVIILGSRFIALVQATPSELSLPPTYIQDAQFLGFFQRVVLANLGYLWAALEGVVVQRIEAEREAALATARVARAQARERTAQESLAARNELVQRLARSDRANLLGLFACSLPHELSQPLTGVQLTLQTAVARLERDGADPEVVAALRAAVGDNERAIRILGQMRALIVEQRVPGGDRQDMVQLVQDVVAIVEARCEHEGVRLETDVPPGPLWVRGDRTHLQQVLLILFANALEAVAGDGESRAISITLARDEEGGSVRFRMRDSGPGLAPHLRDAAFEAYTTTKPGGMGVGLALASRLAETHGGMLAALELPPEDPWRGATFELWLPESAAV